VNGFFMHDTVSEVPYGCGFAMRQSVNFRSAALLFGFQIKCSILFGEPQAGNARLPLAKSTVLAPAWAGAAGGKFLLYPEIWFRVSLEFVEQGITTFQRRMS
jgi:hypothetical protein